MSHGLLPAAALALGAAIVVLAVPAAPAIAHSERVREACTDDFLRLCGDHDPDGRQGEACMRRNQSRLSSACRRALSDAGYRSNGRTGRR